ncbi:MAG TPA: response regulator [Polyangiaceae bacterium]|nr:response regulator [Polyangiaceae bacterium]
MQSDKERVLIVDDEPQVLLALEDLLSDSYVVLSSDSGENALNVMAHEPDIAVVITDHRMPRMSGGEFLARLGHASDTARIMVTGFADLSGVIRAVNDGGIFAYLTKPWDDDDLLFKVRRGAEHFRLNRELVGERQLLQDLLNSVSDGIYFKDTDLRFLRVNRALPRALGLPASKDLIGRRLSELLPGPASDLVEAEERRILAQCASTEDVVREIELDGAQRWFSEAKGAILGADGAVIGLAGITRDVSERLRIGEALRMSEERLRGQSRLLNSILAGMGDGVVVLGRDHEFLVFNERAQRILGFGPKPVTPSKLAETYGIYTPDRSTLLSADQNPLLRAMSGENLADVEVFVKNQGVAGAEVSVTATPLNDDSGNPMGSIALLRDITRQRRLEQQLSQAQKMEAIGRLAGSVAHDFNNLLSVILTYSTMLLGDMNAVDPMREDLESIKKAGEKAADLTRQLLMFGRKQVLAPRLLDLSELVRESETILRRLLREDIEFVVFCEPALRKVRVDPTQIDQVVMNLTVNARDAMPEGGKLTIETQNVVLAEALLSEHCEAAPGPYVMLSVSDTGTGMDKLTQDRIFEPFFTTKALGKGTGLGLATVFGIVQQSGGVIRVESELGRGTTFKIYFSAAEGVDAQVPEVIEPNTLRGTETVLLVEDQDEVRRAALLILHRYGYQVIEARNAGEAWLSAERKVPIHLLLTDVVMPQMSGKELADRLKKSRPDMRVLYMSGYTDQAIVHRGILDEGIAFLQKPFVPDALARRVREVLDAPRDGAST